MSRIDSLYRRLDEIEAGMTREVIRELRKEARGQPSRYLDRKRPHTYMDGRHYRDERTGYLEWLEKEILALRRKLGEALPGHALGVVYEFSDRLDAAAKPWEGGRTAIAPDVLRNLEAAQQCHVMDV